ARRAGGGQLGGGHVDGAGGAVRVDHAGRGEPAARLGTRRQRPVGRQGARGRERQYADRRFGGGRAERERDFQRRPGDGAAGLTAARARRTRVIHAQRGFRRARKKPVGYAPLFLLNTVVRE